MALPKSTQLVKMTKGVSSFLVSNIKFSPLPMFYLNEKSVGILLDVIHLSFAFSLTFLVKLKFKEIDS